MFRFLHSYPPLSPKNYKNIFLGFGFGVCTHFDSIFIASKMDKDRSVNTEVTLRAEAAHLQRSEQALVCVRVCVDVCSRVRMYNSYESISQSDITKALLLASIIILFYFFLF